MTIAAINGSPRGESGSSREVISLLERLGSADLQWTCVSRLDQKADQLTDQDLDQVLDAPVLLITAPLYIDELPATTIRTLERYRDSVIRRRVSKGVGEGEDKCEGDGTARPARQRVFAVINCGFYEGSQNRHALEMMEHFCRETGLEWCGGVGIGTGEMIRGLKNVPLQAGIRRPVVEALQSLVKAMSDSDGRLEENLYTQHRLPWCVYRFLGQMGWRRQARQNGLHRRALHSRPHSAAQQH